MRLFYSNFTTGKLVMMQKIRLIYLLLSLSLAVTPVFSQGLYNGGSAKGAGWLSGQLPENARFNLELGTGFTAFSSGTGILGNYISPRLEYDISPSLTVIAGGTFSFNRYNNLSQSLVVNNDSAPFQQGFTDHSVFAAGRYMINDNLIMTGSLYREEGHLPLVMTDRNVLNYSSQGMSMGLEYKISDNLRFGAEIGVNRSNNPYHHYSPFSDPFGRHGRSGNHRISPFYPF